jgi:hypothetical protein
VDFTLSGRSRLIPKTLAILFIVAVTLLSGCSNERRVRPPAKNTPENTKTDPSFGVENDPPAPRTREEIREDAASERVFENLPDHEMSREEMIQLVREAEREIPDEMVEKTAKEEEERFARSKMKPSPRPSPRIDPSPGPQPSLSVIPSSTPSPRPIIFHSL